MPALDELLPVVLRELAGALQSVGDLELGVFRTALLKASRVFVDGQGRSGLQMRAFAMRLMHLGLTVHVVGEITTPAIGHADLLVLGSASGQTLSLVLHARRARALGAHVALVTARDSSPLAAEADTIVLITAPTPKSAEEPKAISVLPMGTLFEQSLGLLLDMVIVQLMDDLHTIGSEMFARHASLE